MRYLCILLILLVSTASRAQSVATDERHELDTTSYVWVSKKLRVNPYVTAEFERTSMLEQQVSNLSVHWGVLLNDRVFLGSFISVMVDEVYFPLIFPNGFNLEMVHGGLHAGYLWPVTNAFNAGLEARLGFGEMEVHYAESGLDVFSSRFSSVNPSIVLDYQVLRYLKVTGALGYRILRGYDFNTDELADFDGSTLRIGLKLGLFKRLKWPRKEDMKNEE